MASWLSLDSFRVGSKGNLARPLRKALRQHPCAARQPARTFGTFPPPRRLA